MVEEGRKNVVRVGKSEILFISKELPEYYKKRRVSKYAHNL